MIHNNRYDYVGLGLDDSAPFQRLRQFILHTPAALIKYGFAFHNGYYVKSPSPARRSGRPGFALSGSPPRRALYCAQGAPRPRARLNPSTLIRRPLCRRTSSIPAHPSLFILHPSSFILPTSPPTGGRPRPAGQRSGCGSAPAPSLHASPYHPVFLFPCPLPLDPRRRRSSAPSRRVLPGSWTPAFPPANPRRARENQCRKRKTILRERSWRTFTTSKTP